MEKGNIMAVAENVKVTRSGQVLTQRVWDLIDYISETLGKPIYIAQGGHKNTDNQAGGGAGASSGTHDIGDEVDIDDANLTEADVEKIVWLLRYWNELEAEIMSTISSIGLTLLYVT